MADLNVLPPAQEARRPRGVVKLNDTVVRGWTSWEVDNNAFRAADTFRVVFIASDLPPDRPVSWFSDQSSMQVEIFAGLPDDPDVYSADELDSLLLGDVDDIAYDPSQGTIELTGRDWTARLIDTKTSEHFKNQTSSQIAEALAKRHNMTPVVTTTKTQVGDYYKDEHDSTTQQQSEWDLLCYLANVEDFVVYAKGKELHFEPKPKGAGDSYVIAWQYAVDKGYSESNAITLQFNRSLTIAKGVTVEVHSWNAKQKKGFSEFYPKTSKGAKPGQSTAQTQVYRYTRAGLTPESAQKLAQSYYRQIVAHAMKITADLPADQILDCTQTIQVRGTNCSFDQIYYPDSVKRTMSMTEGYRMTVTAKNSTPELEQHQ